MMGRPRSHTKSRAYYDAGYIAGFYGKTPRSSAPHSPTTWKGLEWTKGWDDGNRERQAERLKRMDALVDMVAQLETEPEQIDYIRLRAIVEMARRLQN